eukprot:XP_011679642.1 PREDICTED: uncharacterized protein LOC105445600 isoform X2 [Strongylocentrotus purpuratus]
MLKDEMKVGDRNAEPHVEETLECYICGKDLDGKENEVKCESCPNSYHVACMNISREDKFSDITLVWICLCGNNNISVRMFDHLGIPIDVNQYECISPNQEVMEEPDGTPDECSTSRKIERGRFTKMKSPDDVSASICKKGDGTSLGEPKTGPLTKYAHPDSLINTLEESLKNCDGCLMNFGKQTFLIMSHETGYYIFDAHSRSRKGCQSKQGKSILMHTKTWLGIYTYCIQLLNSMKLSCEETYKLTQVTVAHRSSTDALKHTIPTDTISQDKVDESLMVIQTEDRSVSKPESSQDKVHVTLNWKVQAKPTKPPDEIDVDLKSYRKVQAKPTKPTDEIAVDLKSYRKVQAEPTKSTDEIDVDLKSYRKVQAKPTKPTDEIDVDLKSYRVHAGGKNQKKEAVEVFRLITDTVLYLVLQVGKVCTSIA